MTNLVERTRIDPSEARLDPPVWLEDDLSGQRQRTLAIIAAVAAVAAVVMAALWMSARGGDGGMIAERDAAIAERDESAASRQEIAATLIATQSELNTAQTENQRLQGEVDAALASSATATSATTMAPAVENELASRVNELTVRNQELSDEIAALQAETAATPDEPAGAVSFDATTTPEFARYVGELLSGRTGSSRLAQAQSECFGSVIINGIGLDALGKGLNLSASNADNNVVVGAMQGAASFCNIPLELIF